MSVKVRINGCNCQQGTMQDVFVTPEHALEIAAQPFPPMIPSKTRIFRQYMTTNGLPGGTSDMQIGAATTATYYVPASSTADRYVTAVSFAIADAGATLSNFGNIAALTNGCRFYYEKTNERVYIHEALKTNWDFVRMCLGNPAFGTTTSSFIASNVSGASEGVIPVFDFAKMLPPYGLKLDMGSSEKIVFEVRDQTDGVDAFDAIVYGFERFL
jgi:hypothetical protein